MKKFTIIILLALITQTITAQTKSCFEGVLESAKTDYYNKDYFKALQKLNAIETACSTIETISKSQKLVLQQWRDSIAIGIENMVEEVKAEKERSDSLLLVAEKEKLRADSALNIANTIVDAMYFYDDNYALAFNGEKFGYINKKGEVMIDYEFDEAEMFNENTGYAKVKKTNKDYIIDTLGNSYLLITDLKKINTQVQAIIINNNLRRIPKKILKQKNLVYLDLSKNYIKEIPEDLKNLKKLKLLNLSENQISKVPNIIENLKNLTSLFLVDNIITEIPDEIGKLTSLVNLNLNSNKLIEIPKEISFLSNLKKLNISNCKLETLPDEIYRLNKLIYINISNNKFQQFPSSICNLENLQNLDLSCNKIIEIPDEIINLKKVFQIDLSSNNISEIPNEIGHLTNLKCFFIANNHISILAKEFFQSENMQELDLSYNQIIKLPLEIGNWSNLEKLNISNNLLIEIPNEISNLNKLKYLNLRKNNLKEIPSVFSKLENLIELDLSWNDSLDNSIVLKTFKYFNKGIIIDDSYLYNSLDTNILKLVLTNNNVLNFRNLNPSDFSKFEWDVSDILICSNSKEYDLAINIRKAIFLQTDFKNYETLALYCINAYDFDGAILSSKIIYNKDKKDINSVSLLASSYLWNGEYDEALKLYSRNSKKSVELLRDITKIELRGIVPVDNDDVTRIKEFLNEQIEMGKDDSNTGAP